ncbi:hypothetical protein PASE110613_14695 [Paenibacillus sediminis]|uniref:Uncharacterized protein n=1 Tax=Paenibacillus sediminis TaxID=664909 RepID=A0ABS4H681_9BACL|nr:hypothetical protein [Paenibacillus sediminis]
MDMNVYGIEKLMFQKQKEIENYAKNAWQFNHLKKCKDGFLNKITTRFFHKQTHVDVCCSC